MNPARKPTVAVIGASGNPEKFSHKAVLAHLAKGYQVYPVHPKEKEIAGLKVYASIEDVPGPLDLITVYIPPAACLQIIDKIASKKPRELYLNPGAESPELVEKARILGLSPILACSLTAVSMEP